MAKVKVTILKLAGETGCRKPGSTMQLDPIKAQKFAAKGIVKLPVKRKKKKKDVD